MKKSIWKKFLLPAFVAFAPLTVWAQNSETNVVNVTQLKTIWPENGSGAIRDSLVAIYNDMVVKKNEYILSHREYAHYYTGNSKDYFIIEEYKDMASMEKAADRSSELEKQAWPDKEKAKAFFDAMGAYFEEWHGDGLYRTNPKLSKN